MVQVDPSTKFPELQPVRTAPRLYHLFGFGLYLYGERDFDLETESFVRTLCFCVLYIPVLALRAYRVAPAELGWRFLGRVPVSVPARILGSIGTIALLGACGYLGVHAYLNSPGVVAQRKLSEADQLASQGQVGQAAARLAEVAIGPSEHAAAAAQRLEKLLERTESSSDPEGRGAAFRAAVEVQKIGRWRGSGKTLHDSGVAVAKETARENPAAAWAILEAIAPLSAQDQADAVLRRDLLEKIVAANASSAEWASRLALEYESKGEFDRCEKLLAPLRAQLGDSEGARLLGTIDARADRFEQALPLLRSYTKNRLDRLSLAIAKLKILYDAAQKRIIGRLEKERVYDFDYKRYRDSSPSAREEMIIQYMESKIAADAEIASAKQSLIAESSVAPVAMELGIALLQHAQAQTDQVRRRSLLDEAESNFLAVSRVAGQQAEFQLNLAQVYFWQGKHAEGQKLFDEVLKSHNRDPALLYEVANLLRNLGSHAEARALAEEGYQKASAADVKARCAVVRGLLGTDIEDRIQWLTRATTNDPSVKAILCGDLATQAINQGKENLAISNLKQAAAIYDAMPESSGMLNNASIVHRTLADLTGDPAAYERAGTLIAKAAALSPGNSLTMANAAESQIEAGLRDVIGGRIELKLIKSSASVDLLGFLVKDESERQALANLVRSQSVLNQGLSQMEKVFMLAPRNPDPYGSAVRIFGYRDDLAGLRRVESRLKGVELDVSDDAQNAKETFAGKKDKQMRETAQSAIARFESILPVARAKGGPTFAAAASLVLRNRLSASNLGIAYDADAMVALAEEAFATAQSLAGRWNLIDSLLFRAADRLARVDAGFAASRSRCARAVSTRELLACVLCTPGNFKDRALMDADLGRAIELIRDSYAASPGYTSSPLAWSLLRDRHPDEAAAMAKHYLGSDAAQLTDVLEAKLRPFTSSACLTAYFKARMQNNPEAGRKVLADAKSRGIPIPIENP